MAVNLHAAHKKIELHAAHEALLACLLLSCSTGIITRMQRTKNSLCAAHESWLACSPFRVTCMFWLEPWQKLKNTCMFTTHKCQRIHKLYCSRISLFLSILTWLKLANDKSHWLWQNVLYKYSQVFKVNLIGPAKINHVNIFSSECDIPFLWISEERPLNSAVVIEIIFY